MSWQQPQDRSPYEPPVRQRSDMPTYTVAPQPQPVVVNVVQNAYGGRPVVVRGRVNHKLHALLTIFTGGAWLFVWIPVAIRGGKKVVVYR